jgi:hypothetical protein
MWSACSRVKPLPDRAVVWGQTGCFRYLFQAFSHSQFVKSGFHAKKFKGWWLAKAIRQVFRARVLVLMGEISDLHVPQSVGGKSGVQAAG